MSIASSIAVSPAITTPSVTDAAAVSDKARADALAASKAFATKQIAAKNDADGDLQSDLAKGENPFKALGLQVDTKA